MAAQHKCESCFEMTSADRWTCDECFAEGRAAQVLVARAGGNMAEQQQAFAQACYERAARVRALKASRGQTAPMANEPSYMNPVPAGKIR
jgi:hypothetical protein